MKTEQRKILYFEELPSTNDYAKTLLQNKENVVVIAKRQSGGRGTKGRSFESSDGGIYLTALTFYENFSAKDAFLIMARTAVAVCKTLEGFSLTPVIKWSNDVYVSDKKICGILIENVFSGNKISSSIVGVGLNVNNRLPDFLKEIATTVQEELKREVNVKEVEGKLLENLFQPFSMNDYVKRVGYLNRPLTLTIGETAYRAVALRVEEDGGLIVLIDGEEKKVHSGEVSLSVRTEK